MVYLLTVNYNSANLIAKLIDSLPDRKKNFDRIVIVNNSPEDNKIKNLKKDYIEIIEAGQNLGFGKACNLGLNWIYDRAPNGIVWIINPDTYLVENTLEQIRYFCEKHPEISILGTLIYNSDNELWFGGGRFIPALGEIIATDLLTTSVNSNYLLCDWVSGCSLIINLSQFKACPQFDRNYFLYYEDFDFCRRYLNQGHKIAISDRLKIYHQPSSITNRNLKNKFKHSTYSYLFTLARYSNPIVFTLRFLRLWLNALILLLVKPQVGLGKLTGIAIFLRLKILQSNNAIDKQN
ncbi:MAG: glycosyltransferase family 2 protein [Prochloraceae cyanobacterium]|nr:glycosyltransferase family 2 protein [Prochloraceae cyanobacterium]